MPFPFYLSCFAILVFGSYAWASRREAWGLPVCMVLTTVSVWYVGDVIYNDFESYRLSIGEESLVSAWWQVIWFVIAFGAMVIPMHRLVNARYAGKRSHVVAYLETNRLWRSSVQRKIDLIAGGLLIGWLILMGIALVQVKGNAFGLFAPYLGQKINPWARGQIGGGISALISLAEYLQVFFTASFGVLAAISLNPRTRAIAIIVCCLALPFYVFDRTRNVMLATMLPGILAFVFVRLRSGLPKKLLILLGIFFVINLWFTLVMSNRSGLSFDIEAAMSGKGRMEGRHEGLNMLEELSWINHFIDSGSYQPNFGARYFAEIVNPIPRGLWKNKPTIGLDYAVARGQKVSGAKGEMTATISTGMIGQGVVNFGRFFGPVAAAFLMALWVAILARQDLKGADPGRLILYGCGLVLTFNMGRDVTLLVLYPFFFGLGLLWVFHRLRRRGDTGGDRKRRQRRERGSGSGERLPKKVSSNGRM